MKIQVITDSTSDIPQEMADNLGIKIVPIYIRFGEKTYRDGVDIKNDEFYSVLASSEVHPATSQPNPEDFTAAYHTCELTRRNDTTVLIDAAHRGLGTASCGPDTLETYQIAPGRYTLSYAIIPLAGQTPRRFALE